MMPNQEPLAGVGIFTPDAPLGTATVFQTAGNGINMKNWKTVVAVFALNSAGTAHAVTMKQGTTSSPATTLAFTKYFYKTTGDWTAGTAESNTFNADGAVARLFAVPITADMLDKTQGSEDTYVRMDVAAQTATAGALFYLCFGPRFGGDTTSLPAIT